MNRPLALCIGLNIDIAVAPLARLAGQLKTSSADVKLVIRRVDSLQMPGLLMSGEISVGVGRVLEGAPDLEMTALGKTALIVVWRRANESDSFQTWFRNELLKCFNVMAPSSNCM
ncbi:hypothetical protein C1X59_08325 [Pseudomonas sp. FW215-R2]|jgi:hypothetical protein|uniref:hypothetical protein n=1 Tax=unclassified Pseudomonas TaxID=196821 RepID=UPI000C88441A|nr:MULTISPECIES: hypothetical protein [unclassified Pseudomonas]PMX02320.1 hypothetical protein C1X59_08325 [Pseudomonas sp. FW215-R2]PMX11006.1 hypothetical protein C1X60_07615 [Pseudomonas sp. FW215-L1]PMX20808.1 hypothetical protein C1X57_19945 [Pseudomonas sp. FW215-E1]PNA25475.1 hypothetical protein C1X58_22145 [Pseudomonas sp. FW215-R4]